MFELFGIGKAWEGAFRSERSTERSDGVVPDRPIGESGLKMNSGGRPSEKTREGFRTASDALRTALRGFARQSNPVYTTTVNETRAVAGFVSGASARVDPFSVDFAHLQTTSPINTWTDTSRASDSAIGLDVTSAEAASRTASTSEMNTGVTTSYASSTLAFSNGGGNSSTSQGRLTGTYTGVNTAANATSLRLTLLTGSTLGGGLLGVGASDNVQFTVTDQDGTVLFNFNGTLAPNEAVYLGDDIGLSLSFSAGSLKKNHFSSTTVSKTPISVDTNATFNNANASLRPKFDNNAQVSAGSFTINGTAIAVAANDSINSVISRINGSGAGVTAAVSGDRITLTTNGSSEDAIVLGNDTSGFLAATRLSGAATTLGNVRDDRQVFSKTSQFAGVTTGSFTVNGMSIAVNASTDSLDSVIGRVNGSGAGVTASYDSATDTLLFTPDVAGATLTIEDDTSGFLAAARVAAGTSTTQFNPDAAFNAKKNGPAFDSGLSVRAGTFTVNGTSIAVAAGDSVTSVLAKITASAAGVIASYDAAAQRVTLDAKEGGSGPITLGADTSGFLAAVKLDGTAASSVTTATYSSLTSALGEMAEYAGVKAGTLTVNGQNIAIDPETTTVQSLVAALNGLSGVAATVNEVSGGIDLWAESGGASLTISDTSNVVDALGITTGTYEGSAGRSSSVTTLTGRSITTNAADVAAQVSDAVTALNDVLADLAGVDVRAALDTAIDGLRDRGIHGLQIAGDGDELTLSVARDQLVNSLNGIADDRDLANAIDTVIEEFAADVTKAAGWDTTPPTVQSLRLADTSRAQLAADQTATTLLYLRSSLEPAAPETTKAALKAYGT
jgi:sulfur carrier protein ThiS